MSQIISAEEARGLSTSKSETERTIERFYWHIREAAKEGRRSVRFSVGDNIDEVWRILSGNGFSLKLIPGYFDDSLVVKW